MIISSHSVIVKFTPVTGDGRAFSDEAMAIKTASISGGSYSSSPYLEGFSKSLAEAIEMETDFMAIILKYGGKIVE